MADSKENYWWDLGSERVKALHLSSYMIEWNKLQLDDRSLKVEKFELNPLTPYSDLHLISPYNITPESHTKVRRIMEMINNYRSSGSIS